MKLPAFLEGIPQTALILAVPVLAFLITIGISLGTSGRDNDSAAAPTPTAVATLQAAAPTATATRAPTPSPTAQPNRANCASIRGTSYQSEAERTWYNANCGAGSNQASAPSSTAPAAPTAGSASAPVATAVPQAQAPAPSQPAPAAPAPAPTGPVHPIGVEYALGARLIVPAAGIDAVVTGMDVGDNGAMPDPVGYFNAVMYNFPYFPGLGGTNKVLAGHVDCGRCYNGGPGTAVFWSVRDLPVGASAQFVNPDGSVQNFVVSGSYAISAATDFSGIVSAGAADMTIITCTGTFSGGHYDNRHVVTFTLV